MIQTIRLFFRKQRQLRKVRQWEASGRPSPPPHLVKQDILRQYVNQFHCKVLVETGTYYGDMVNALLDDFETIHTIELSQELHKLACERFADVQKVNLIQGDSGSELAKLVPEIDQPALFWLDGHYSAGPTALGSKETPVIEELEHLFEKSKVDHVILIDDAREFSSNPAYPTLDEVRQFVQSKSNRYEISVDTDIIRITPKVAAQVKHVAA